MTITQTDPRQWFNITNKGDRTARVDIYDEIGFWGVTAKDFVGMVKDLDVDTIDVHINSPGGDYFDGLAILNTLRDHKAQVVVTIDGLAASAASFVAMAGNQVIMARNSELMIHEAHALAIGDASEMRDIADRLDHVSDNIAAIYADRAGGDPITWRDVMRAETWYSAEEAVSAGLADKVAPKTGAAADAKNRFDYSIFNYAGRAAAPPPPVIPRASARATNPPPAGQGQPEKEGAAVTDTAKLREALGLSPDTSDDEVTAAVHAAYPVPVPAAQPSNSATPVAAAASTTDDSKPQETAASSDVKGTIVVSTSVWEETQNTIKDLSAFVEKTKRDERDVILAQAVADGKFRPSQLKDFKAEWDKNPDGIRNLVAKMTPNSALAVAASGYANDLDDESIEAEFAGLFPPSGKGR